MDNNQPWGGGASNDAPSKLVVDIHIDDLPDAPFQERAPLDHNEAILDFTKALEAYGLVLTGLPEATGTIKRVATKDDKRGKKTGWYVLYDGEILGGSFGDFRKDDGGNTWSSVETNSMSIHQRTAFQRQMVEAKEKREAERLELQKVAAIEARAIWDRGRNVIDYPYLIKKKLDGSARVSQEVNEYHNGWMMLPLLDEAGEIVSLQFISDTGDKYFHKDGRLQGCYNLIEGEKDEIYIAEGYATGMTVTMATGKACAVAWNANNLMAVAENIRAKFPSSILIIAGDNDHETKIGGKLVNVGYNKATAVASRLGIKAVFPECKAGESDFNDILVQDGLENVRLQLTKRVKGLPEPLPLRPQLPPAQDYPVDALGPIMSNAVKHIAYDVQLPVAIAAQSVLANAALAAQGHYDVEMLFGESRPLSLYFLSVLHSGGRKSTSDSLAGKPIKEFEKKAREDFKSQYTQYQNRVDVWKAKRNATMKDKNISDKEFELDALGEEPYPPMSPVLTIPEPTAEALQKCLGLERPSMGLFSDEGGQFIGGYSNSTEKQLATATILSSIWDGQAIKRNRVLEGSSAYYGRRLSIHLMVQDGIANIMSGNDQFRSQGILARFLMSAPESLIGTRFYREPGNMKDLIYPYHKSLSALFERPLPVKSDSDWELCPETLKIAPDAKDELVAFGNEIEQRQAPDQDLNFIADFASKLVEHAVRLSAVIQVVADQNSDYISLDNIRNGIALTRYYLSETVRMRKVAVSDDIQKAEILLEWLKEHWTEDFIYLSPIMHKGPNSIRLKRPLMKAIGVLEDHKYLIPCELPMMIDGSLRKECWQFNHR